MPLEFLRQYLRVCTEVKKYTITKADFPPAWIRFAPPNLGEDAVPVISTSSAPSSTTAPSTSLSNSKNSSPATMTSPESPSAVGSAQTASTSSWSEIQKPVCNVSGFEQQSRKRWLTSARSPHTLSRTRTMPLASSPTSSVSASLVLQSRITPTSSRLLCSTTATAILAEMVSFVIRFGHERC